MGSNENLWVDNSTILIHSTQIPYAWTSDAHTFKHCMHTVAASQNELPIHCMYKWFLVSDLMNNLRSISSLLPFFEMTIECTVCDLFMKNSLPHGFPRLWMFRFVYGTIRWSICERQKCFDSLALKYSSTTHLQCPIISCHSPNNWACLIFVVEWEQRFVPTKFYLMQLFPTAHIWQLLPLPSPRSFTKISSTRAGEPVYSIISCFCFWDCSIFLGLDRTICRSTLATMRERFDLIGPMKLARAPLICLQNNISLQTSA